MASKQDKQLQEITKKLEEGVKDMLTSENYTEYLKIMSRFHDYSFNNTMLIAMQKPEATLVAGYQAWQKKFERHVKKGEKGIQIIAPAPIREKEEVEKIDPVTNEPILKENGQPETEIITHVIPRFRVATVFDVSQTDGKPLPEFGIENLNASVEHYEAFMQAITHVSPVPIRYDEIEGEANGYYHQIDKEIVIQEGMSESQTMKTAVHEVSHAKLHDREIMEELGTPKDKMTREVEAESIAYCVCQYFGLDTSEYSFPYIGSWSSGKDMKELRASMDTIRRTAGEFIDSMTAQLQEILRENAEIDQIAEIRMDDVILRKSGSMGSDYEYCVINDMTAEQLESAVREYARLIEEDAFVENDVPLEDYLKERGAAVTAVYASNGLGEDNPVDFFDVEYDVDIGVTVFADLGGQRQAEMLIAKAEYTGFIFNDEEKNLIANYGYKFDDAERTRLLIDAIMQAQEYPDVRTIYRVMAAAREEIDALPDATVGFTELHRAGYFKEGMLPLSLGRAVELHHQGVPVFALHEQQEILMDTELSILEDGGMFGVNVSDWEAFQNRETIREDETRYQEVELFDVPVLFANERIPSDILPEDMYRYELRGSDNDSGYPATVENQVMVNHAGTILTAVPMDVSELGYLRLGEELNFTGGMVTLREYQQAMASVDQGIEAEKMENAIGRANENLYLGGYDDRYAIYQIHPDGKGRAYQFMGMDFVTSHQLSVEGMDYRFIYGGRLSAKDTLDSLYDRFNLNHPESYEGHSLSVSDVIIMQRNHQAQAYYVDSFGFKELPEFVLQRQKEVEKERAREDSLVNEDTTGLEVEQHEGTWHTVEAREIGDEMFYRMEHDTYGDSVSSIIVNADGDLVAQDLEHGFDRDAMEAIREYFSEKGVEWEPETAPDVVQPEAAWNKKTYPPVVYEGAVVALEKGMIEEYRDSWKLNVACKDAIEDAIRNNFDGMHLAPDVVQPVLEEYGQERLTYLLVSTLRQKREDGRFSRDNKAWAEDYTFDGERNIVLSPDFLVDSHPAVLNGFIDLARDEFEALEKMADRENEEPFISRYFVVNDAYGIKEEREYQYFEDFSGAFAAYHMLPNHFDKQIGMESTEQPPSRMTLIRCENGVETLEDVEADSLSGKWLKPDVMEAVSKAETYLKEWDTELAYQIKNGERYFFIQTTSGGYDYTFYDKEFKELDGGVYEDPDISIQEAIEEILSDEDGVSFSDCKVIDCDKLWETVERAEYFPQKAYEGLRELMDSDADEAAFQCGYGYVSIQKVPEGYEYISYDSEWKEIGGDLYDIPEATMEDVVTWIFKDEGLGDLDCKPIDYEEVVQGTLRSAKERLAEDKLTPTSQISRRETALGGNSRHDIEETVLCYAQAELEEMGLSDEVKLLAARVYGSWLREGLYTEKSDVDVVLSYSGDIREDAFFNALHEHGMEIGGLTVDINPISMEKTGTLEAYMEQAEKYLDGKEIEKLAVDLDTFSYDNDFYEYQDEVEDREQELQKLKQELMEGRTEPIKSYLQVFVDEGEPEETVSEAQHLIDRLCQAEDRNLFHQEEQVEPSISFYVAECMEYPVMGEYHENLTLQEAYELYEKIPPERINGVKGIGFRLEDGSIYDGLFELMSGGTVIKDVINEIPHYKESPLVQKAIADMEAILADHGIQKVVEPEKEPAQAADRAAQEDGWQEKTSGSREEKMPETAPKVSNPAKEPGTGRKDSVLKALRERQAKLKAQEQEKQPKDKTQSRKKGEQDL